MHAIAFWKTWPVVYQRVFIAVAGLFVAAQLFLWNADVHNPAPVIEPEHFQQLESLDIPVHQFQLGLHTLSISSEVYTVLEHVFGGAISPNSTASHFFVFLLAAGIVLILTVLTALTRFWFFVGMGLFVLVLVSLRVDNLTLFGVASKIPVMAIVAIYIFIAYYFMFLRSTASFPMRLVVFSIVTAVLGVCIAYYGNPVESSVSLTPGLPPFFSETHPTKPFVYLAAHGLVAGIALTLVFIFMVAHEIVASFIFVVNRAALQRKSLQHFLVITAIYLVNLALIYADKKHIVQWNFFPFPLFLLITVSGVLGIWGFRQREPLYESILRANPYGVYFFTALAAIAFSTMAFLLASANDPGIQLVQDAILYSHLGYGLIFLIYVIVNFLSLLGNNMPVYKVLYKPTVMPYFTFRFAGLIATFAFFAYSNWKVSVNQAYAAYYNAMGDYHWVHNVGPTEAEGYYQRSIYFATRNYHAHYALAQIFGGRNESVKEKEEYRKLVDGRPLDLAYLNLSQLYVNDNALPEAVKILKQGLRDFPKNGLLQNALSLVDSRMGLRDSALLMANKARNSPLSRGEAETNITAFSAKFQFRFPADSMMSLLNSDYSGVLTNVLALAGLQGKIVPLDVDPGTDTILTVYSATALNNYFVNRYNPVDTAIISKATALARKPSNAYFKNFLLSAAAHAYYRKGESAKAFKLMHEIAFLGQQSKYYNVLGLWALEQGATGEAIRFLDEALRLNGKDAYFNKAVALTEAGKLAQALESFDSLQRSGDPDTQKQALRMITVLRATPDQAVSLGNEEKVEFARHRFSTDQEKDFEKFIATVPDQVLQARAIVDRSKRLEETDDTPLAMNAFALARRLKFPDKALIDEIVRLNLRFLAKLQQWPLLEQQLRSGISFKGAYASDSVYLHALLDEHAGRKEQAAKAFAWLIRTDPFFEDAVVAAVRFLNTNGEDKVKTYGLLMNALDQNPDSPKLLKAYILQSASVGFEESAQDALDKLKALLHPRAFLQFIDENREIFEVQSN